MLKKFSLLLLVASLLTVTSCRKIREDNLVKGLWQVQYFKIDTTTINNRSNPVVRAFIDTAAANEGDFLHSLLPNYTANKANAYYRIKYDREDISFSYYNINEVNVYTVLGKWDLPKEETITLSSDNFLDGTFEIVNKGNYDTYDFKSELNYIKTLNDTVSVVMKIKRVK
jgi:hypothetical protein